MKTLQFMACSKSLKKLNVLVTLVVSLFVLFPQSSVKADSNPVNSRHVVEATPKHHYKWGYPFASQDTKGVHPLYFSQTFGNTDYARSLNPLSYFHDGWDFGYSEVGHTNVLAIHPGTVK